MTEKEKHELVSAIVSELKPQKLSCSETASDMVLEHSKLFVQIQETMKHLGEKMDTLTFNVNDKMNRVDKKMDIIFKSKDEHSKRLTIIETEKRTWFAIFLSIGAITWDFLKDFISK